VLAQSTFPAACRALQHLPAGDPRHSPPPRRRARIAAAAAAAAVAQPRARAPRGRPLTCGGMHGGAASKSTRTFGDFESVADAMKGICQLYEQRLMQMNPGQGQAPAPCRAAPAAFGAADTGIRRYFTAGTMACNNSKGACKGLQTRLSDKQSAAPNPINPPHHVIPCTPPPCLFCDSAAHVGWSVAHSLILALQGPDDRALAPGPGGISSPLHRLVKHVAHVLQRALSRVLSARQHLDDGGDASVFAREQSLSQAQTIRHASQTFTTVLKILRRAQGRQLNRVRALLPTRTYWAMRFKCAKTRSLTHCLLCGSYAPYPLCTRQHKSPSWSMKAYSSVMSYVIFRTPGRAYKRQATRRDEYRTRNRKSVGQHQDCALTHTWALSGNPEVILDTPT